MRKLLGFLLLSALPLCAQNVRYDAPFPSITSQYATPFLVANTPSTGSPKLSVCNSPANALPCTNYATTYTSSGSACPNGAQDTPQPQPSACQATGDAQGNIGFWAPAGTYDYTVCVNNNCQGPYTITLTSGSALVVPAVVASTQAGADWCAKVNAADTSLGSGRGEIWVSTAAGTSVCSGVATISSNHTLRFFGGAYTASCSGINIQSQSNVEIFGLNNASISLPNNCANFSRPIHITSSTNVIVQNLEVNGNGTSQQVGEQDHDIIVFDSNQVKILNNYLHDAQGDALLVGTDSSMTAGCEDVLVQGNTFANIGRQFTSVTGYGCNDVRILDNHYTYGTPVSTSTSRGNPIHIEGDNAGTGFNRITIGHNDFQGAVGTCISTTSQDTNPILGLIIDNNNCIATNSSVNLSAGIAVLMAQEVSITGNKLLFSGSTTGTDGILVQEASAISAQLHRVVISANDIESPSSYGIHVTSSASSGTPQSFDVADNIVNGSVNTGITVVNNFSDLSIHDNVLTNLQNFGIHLEGAARFDVHDNNIRDFGLAGGSQTGIDLACNGSFTTIGPGKVHDNYIGSATTTSKTGIVEGCTAGDTLVYVYNNETSQNATGVNAGAGYINGLYPLNLTSLSPFTIGSTTLYEDSVGNTLGQRNGTTVQTFNIWGSYPSGEFLKLTGNYAGGDPGIQCGGTNCNLNLSTVPGTGSMYFRTAYNNGSLAAFIDQNAKLSVNGAVQAASLSTTLAGPAAPTVTPTNGSATTWTYVIVAKDANNNVTLPSNTGTTAVGAATLDGTHFNTITWQGVTAGVCYDVRRTVAGGTPNTTGKIGTVCVPNTLSLVDNGLAGDASSSPTVNTTGGIPVPYLQTSSQCSAAGSAANPSIAACSGAPSGAFSCATNASGATCQVNTTAVTANSDIEITSTASAGTRLSVTCNTTADAPTGPRVLSINPRVSFTINLGTFSTNPECFFYTFHN